MRISDWSSDVCSSDLRLRETITVMAQLDPSMIDISATWADSGLSDGANARISQQIVQKLVDIFQETNLSSDKVETSQSLAFLDQQLAARGKQLAAAEQRRAEFGPRYAGSLPGPGHNGQPMAAARSDNNNPQ